MEDSQNESFEDIELTEMEDRPEYQEPVLELSAESQRPRQTRSRRIPEKWTRVISLNQDNLNIIVAFELASDLLLANGLPAEFDVRHIIRPRGRPPVWKPLFFAKTFVQ